MSDNLSSSAIHPDELCLLCDPAFSQGLPVSVILRGGRAVPIGGKLQEAFYRLLWRDYGLSPGLVECLAVDGVLASTSLHHSCGMSRLSDLKFVWSCLSLLLLWSCGFYVRSACTDV